MSFDVQFPGLGLEFTINRVALSIGGFNIYWYGVIIAAGMVLAMLFAFRNADDFGINSDRLIDVILVGAVMAIVCARIYYIVFAPFKYESIWQMIDIRQGGIAIYGAVIGAFVFGGLMAKIRRIPILPLFDLVGICFLIGQGVGRWGNFMNREAFGAETTLPWRMQLTTVTGQLVEVHPTFLYESLWNLVGLLLIIFVVSKARRFDGENTWFYFLWYGIGRFWVEGLRTDSLYLFNWTIGGQPIRVSQALSLVMVFVSLFMLYYNIKLHPHKPEELYVNIVAARNAAAAEAAAAPAAESPAQAAPTEDAPAEAVSSETEAPSQEEPSGEAPTEDPS